MVAYRSMGCSGERRVHANGVAEGVIDFLLTSFCNNGITVVSLTCTVDSLRSNDALNLTNRILLPQYKRGFQMSVFMFSNVHFFEFSKLFKRPYICFDMSKPRNQKPLLLTLNFLPELQLYQTFDNEGIEYRMPHSLMDDLKRKFKSLNDVAEWYKTLFPAERRKVIRIGLPYEDLNYYDGNFIE